MTGPADDGPPSDSTVPAFGRGVKFRFDGVRQSWVLLAPERLFVPDEQAIEILKLVDGVRSLGAIIDELAERFAAPRDLIARDVAAMLGDLANKGAISL
jgi:pyrroloquinoline quinone biosynthesis protein D